MDKREMLDVISESLREENTILDKKYEALLEEIQFLTRKVTSLYEMIEMAEEKYGTLLEDIMARDHVEAQTTSMDKTNTSEYGIGSENIVTNTFSEPEQMTPRVVIDEYTNNLAARVNYCLRPYYYDERQKNSDIFGIEKDIHDGNAERYMVALNNILDTQNFTDEMVEYISEVIVDLAEYVAKEPEKVEENEMIQDNSVGATFGTYDEVDSQNIDNVKSSNVSVQIEESINPVTEEITTHYKKLDSGIFFADWVNTQQMDYRIKDALASIDYIIDEVAKKPGISIIVDDGALGIQTSKGATFYKDEKLGNKISAFLIDIKNLMDNDIYIPAIINCYDSVRSAERELVSPKKKDIR